MELKLGKPVIVAQGMTHEEGGWGPYQFPRIYNANGVLYTAFHQGKDEWGEIGGSMEKWFISTDRGQSWQPTDAEKAEMNTAVTAPNGDRIVFIREPGRDLYHMKHMPMQNFNLLLPGEKREKARPGYLPLPSGVRIDSISGSKIYTYDMDYLSEEFEDDRIIKAIRYKKGETAGTEEIQTVNWTHRPLHMWWNDTNKNSCTCPTNPAGLGGRIKPAPDGTLWMTTPGNLDPKTGAYSYYNSCVILTSDNNGKTWNYKNRIEYIPDTNENPFAYMEDGFNESDFAFMPDGSVIMLMRVNSAGWAGINWSPLYFSRSTDMGNTWSKPEIFADGGILPRICQLGCGATVAIYGRPGIFVRATDDPSGIKWDEPIEVMTPKDRSHLRNEVPERPTFHQYAGSCCNCYIAPVDENTAIITYSDFYYPDETGLKRKTILTQTVTVEK